MQHAVLQHLQSDIAKAYEAGDLDAAIQNLTKAFEKRTGDTIPGLLQIDDEDESKVVKDWRDLLGPGGPEGETAEDFLKPIYDRRDASGPRNLF